jgi:DNA-binding NarL/FixJ family response regulator
MIRQSIYVAISNGHPLFRKILKDFISGGPTLKVMAEAEDVYDLLKSQKKFPGYIVMLNVFMLKTQGSEALRIVSSKFPKVKVIVLSMSTDLQRKFLRI